MRYQILAAVCLMAFWLVATAACSPKQNEDIDYKPTVDNWQVWHDDENNVTCWIFREARGYGNGVGASCLPDHMIEARE